MEIFFTAFWSLFAQTPVCDKPLGALAGISYVWMAFIYGLVPILGVLFFDRVKSWSVWARLLLYVVIIYSIEFSSGFLLELITGSCPWQYTSGWQVMGLIRLDYFPFWLVFAWLAERGYVFLSGLKLPA